MVKNSITLAINLRKGIAVHAEGAPSVIVGVAAALFVSTIGAALGYHIGRLPGPARAGGA